MSGTPPRIVDLDLSDRARVIAQIDRSCPSASADEGIDAAQLLVA